MHYDDYQYHLDTTYNEHHARDAQRAAIMRARRMEAMALRQAKQERADAWKLGIMFSCILLSIGALVVFFK